MSPTFSRGDIIYYHPVASISDLAEGDIVSFRLNDHAIVSHRIHQFLPDGSFETTGDNNTESDKNKVSFSSVLGLVQPIVIPRLGYFVDLISYRYLAVAVLCVTILLIELYLRNYRTYSSHSGREQETHHDQISSISSTRSRSSSSRSTRRT